MPIFSTFLELHFSGLKNILYYPEYQKMFVSGFFWPKKTYEKKVDFLTKTMDWTFWKISIFSTFLELYFSGVKSILYFPEYQKMFLSGFFLPKKEHIRNRSIFWQKPFTNPFVKCGFFLTSFRTSLFRCKKRSLLSRISKIVSFWLFLPKKNI